VHSLKLQLSCIFLGTNSDTLCSVIYVYLCVILCISVTSRDFNINMMLCHGKKGGWLIFLIKQSIIIKGQFLNIHESEAVN